MKHRVDWDTIERHIERIPFAGLRVAGPRPMKGALVGIAGALGLIAYVGVTGGLVDFFFPPQAEVTRSSSLSGEPAAVSLSHPLGCDLRIRDCLPSGRQCSRERCYVASSHKEAQ